MDLMDGLTNERTDEYSQLSLFRHLAITDMSNTFQGCLRLLYCSPSIKELLQRKKTIKTENCLTILEKIKTNKMDLMDGLTNERTDEYSQLSLFRHLAITDMSNTFQGCLRLLYCSPSIKELLQRKKTIKTENCLTILEKIKTNKMDLMDGLTNERTDEYSQLSLFRHLAITDMSGTEVLGIKNC